MMYIDSDYYDNEYLGEPVEDPAEFNRMVKRASELVDIATRMKSQNVDLNSTQGKLVKKAVASQVEHYVINGGYEEYSQDSMATVGVGGFNYTIKDNGNTKGSLTDISMNHLLASGLLYSGLTNYG